MVYVLLFYALLFLSNLAQQIINLSLHFNKFIFFDFLIY